MTTYFIIGFIVALTARFLTRNIRPQLPPAKRFIALCIDVVFWPLIPVSFFLGLIAPFILCRSQSTKSEPSGFIGYDK